MKVTTYAHPNQVDAEHFHIKGATVANFHRHPHPAFHCNGDCDVHFDKLADVTDYATRVGA